MSKRAVVIIFAGFLTVFIAYAVRYAYGMLLPEMLHTLSISKTQAGVVYFHILSPIRSAHPSSVYWRIDIM